MDIFDWAIVKLSLLFCVFIAIAFSTVWLSDRVNESLEKKEKVRLFNVCFYVPTLFFMGCMAINWIPSTVTAPTRKVPPAKKEYTAPVPSVAPQPKVMYSPSYKGPDVYGEPQSK